MEWSGGGGVNGAEWNIYLIGRIIYGKPHPLQGIYYCYLARRFISHCNSGTLQAVDSLMVEGLNISWTAPFSLRADLITYCVEVTDNEPSDRVLSVLSLCGITVTTLSIQSPSPRDITCKLYRVTVVPANQLGNGTASSVVQSLLLDRGNKGIHSHARVNTTQLLVWCSPT
jgi:hypothetical protein